MDTVLSQGAPPLEQAEEFPTAPGFFATQPAVLSPLECKRIIEIADAAGFSPAALKGDDQYNFEYRRSARCIIDSVPFAEELWRRIRAVVPSVWDGGEYAVGLNERLRILRYEPGDEFKTHADGTFIRRGGEELSKITVLVYLNEGYDGGRTTYVFGDGQADYEVVPTTGAVVLQDQNILHYVPALTAGVKYALRTEVMYRVKSADAPVYKNIVIRAGL